MHDDNGRAGAPRANGHARRITMTDAPFQRRTLLKAVAGLGAIAAAGGVSNVQVTAPQTTRAQEAHGTIADTWEASGRGGAVTTAAAGDWVTFQANFPFYALGMSWQGGVGEWPVVELQVSHDGSSWSETERRAAFTEDGGQPNRDGRLFSALAFYDGPEYVRYRTVDQQGNPGEVTDLQFHYIDATDGPWSHDLIAGGTDFETAANDDMQRPPAIVTRAAWGANEDWRFDSFGEIWPPRYQTVSHIIIHHTATPNNPIDPAAAIRSIYQYHAITQGWGDIGYNYLVDQNGTIYEGRHGGQNVIGGHSYEYANGSSGISAIGDFRVANISEAQKAGLVSITAWAARDLDPNGQQDFLEVPNLPIISSHRDVSSTTCPGDNLYNELPSIRNMVAAAIPALDSDYPAGIIIGDRVRIATGDGTALNLRSTANGTVTGSIADNAAALVIGGPEEVADANWYQIEAESGSQTGWAIASYMIVEPPPPPPQDPTAYPFGTNMRFTATTNIRSGPSTNHGIRATVQRNTWAFILGGPTTSDGRDWYNMRVVGAGDGWAIRANLAPAPVNTSPNAQFSVGDTVEATQNINVRPRPGLAQTVIATASAGTRMTVSVAPIEVTDHIWYGVAGPFGGGWVVEAYLRGGQAPPPGQFEVGDSVRTTDALNLRTSASTAAGVIAVLPNGATGTVVGGPQTGSGYTWWQIQTNQGTGWAVQNWLAAALGQPDPDPDPPGDGQFSQGDTVRTTDALNLRTSASTAAGVITVLPNGATGTVVGGPQTGSGYTWWQIQTSQGTGWAVQNWLTATSSQPDPDPDPPPSDGRFSQGDSVRTTDALNMRTSANISAGVITVLPNGATGTVVGGPTTASGYTWWRIQTSSGTGWVVQNWLTAGSGSSPGGISVGSTIVVSEGPLNLRTGASISAGVLRTLPTGHRATVVGGPQSASGYTWYQVQSSSLGTGWVAGNYIRQG